MAIETWISFKKILLQLGSPSFDVRADTALLRILPQLTPSCYRLLLSYIIKIICYNICIYRCQYLYDKIQVKSKDIILAIKNEIKTHCLVTLNTRHIDKGKSLQSFAIDEISFKIEKEKLIFKS